jgi:hypothetical protein
MSIPVLVQTYEEVRRLAIAGSVVAPGDFRLKKLSAPLDLAGKKAPVFAKVAQAATALVESNEKASAHALLALSTLVSAILYTQGETVVDGEFTPILSIDLGHSQSRTPARLLRPLLDALSSTGSGRMETIREAHERGSFRDIRLVRPALAALDDGYPEVAEFIAREVLPIYGRAILPELIAAFDPQSRLGAARRLRLMVRLDPEGTREKVKTALDLGSKEVKIAAIECLGDSPGDLSYLLEQARSRTKDVRAAALLALGRSSEPDAVAAVMAALRGKDFLLAVRPIQDSKNAELSRLALLEAQQQFTRLIGGKEKAAKAPSQLVERMMALLDCLRWSTDEAAGDWLVLAFEARKRLAAIKGHHPSGQDVELKLAEIMSTGPTKAGRLLADSHASLPVDALGHAFIAGVRSYSPQRVYDMFSRFLMGRAGERKRKNDPSLAREEAVANAILHGEIEPANHDQSDEQRQSALDLDPRWLDLAVECEHLELAMHLAKPEHLPLIAFLEREFRRHFDAGGDVLDNLIRTHDLGQILATMVRIGHPSAVALVEAMFRKCAKDHMYHTPYFLSYIVGRLPKEAHAVLEPLVPLLPSKAASVLIDGLDELKMKA